MNEPRTATTDVYTLVTNRIIEQLEKGTVPWQKPWTDGGIPQNLLTHHPYRGINVWLLASLDYSLNYFLTFKQVREIGASVAKGEKAHMVVFWKALKEGESEGKAEDKKPKRMLRYYWVFNIEQCTNIPDHLIYPVTKPQLPFDACEDIITGMPNRPPIKHKQAKAFYVIEEDYINMPKLKSFTSHDSYYATLFHELIHSTGHKARLDRKELNQMAEFGSEPYSIEELTAEMGSCYLTSLVGITTTFTNSVAYIEGWLRQLKNDSRFIVYASSQAQRAVDCIVNVGKEGE